MDGSGSCVSVTTSPARFFFYIYKKRKEKRIKVIVIILQISCRYNEHVTSCMGYVTCLLFEFIEKHNGKETLQIE